MTTRTGLACTPVNLVEVLKATPRTISLDVVTQGRASRIDRFLQNCGNDLRQASRFLVGNGSRSSCRMYPGPEKHFTHIYIAETCNKTLIQQRGFDRRATTGEKALHFSDVEPVRKWLHPQRGEERMGDSLPRLEEEDSPETPGVHEAQPRALPRTKDDVLVQVRALRVNRLILINMDTSGHSKMKEQRLASREIAQDIFATTPDAENSRASDSSGQVIRDRPPQIMACDLHAGYCSAFYCGSDAAHDRLDFGKLWHM